ASYVSGSSRPEASFLPDALTLKNIYSVLGYYSNWRILLRPDGRVSPLLHTWSLSVEEQFYFLWPPALAGLLWLRLPRPAVLAIVLAGIAASAGLRACLWQGVQSFPALYMRLATRADALLVGCLTALLARWGMLPQSRRAWGVVRLAAHVAL